MHSDHDLKKRIKKELEEEGYDERSIWKMAEDALKELVRRIAGRLGETFERVWNALVALGNL